MAFLQMWGRRAFALALLALTVACGGGGGRDSPSGTAPAQGSPGFTLSRQSVSLAVEPWQSPVPVETVTVSLQSQQVYSIAAGYRQGVLEPSWLDVSLDVTSPSTMTLGLSPRMSLLPAPGTYSATLSVGSFNANGDFLGYYDIAVTLTVSEATTITGPTLVFNAVHGAPAPSPLALALTMPSSRSWTAQGNESWLRVMPNSGTGNDVLAVSVDVTGLPVGDYSGQVSIVANGRTQTRPLSLSIRPPSLVSQPAALDVALQTGAALPAATALQINFSNGGATNWSLVSKPDWVNLSKTAGTTPDVLHAAVNVPLTTPATRAGEIVLTDATGTSLRIPVTAAVTGPTISVSVSALSFSGVNGSTLAAQNLGVALSDGSAGTWMVTPAVSWLRVAAGTGSTGNAAQLSVDAETPALASGTYTTQLPVSVSWGGRALAATVPVTLNLTRATLGVSTATITLGGAIGRDFSAGSVSVNLNTGARSHAWSVSGAPVWLSATPAASTVGGAGVGLSLLPDPALVAPGSTAATLQLRTQVNGDTITTPLTVNFNRDARRLVASDNGVALTQTPSWSRLTRSLKITDSFGRAGTWSATSNQSWLQVTASGAHGGNLTVTANPAGLALDRLYTAAVTVTSNDGERPSDVIQVGLWVGSSTPTTTRNLTGRAWLQAAPDPIRPYVYVHDGGTDIYAYNVYTGLEVGRVPNVAGSLGTMAVASDGQWLYVVNTALATVVPVNLSTLTVGTPFATSAGPQATRYLLAYGRVNGTGILAGAGPWFVVNGAVAVKSFTGLAPNRAISFSRDGTMWASVDQDFSPSNMGRQSADYTAVGGGTFVSSGTGSVLNVGSFGNDVALSADGSVVFVTCNAPYLFQRFAGTPLAAAGTFAGSAYPTGVKVASDGRIFAASRVNYGPTDVWIYTAEGALVTSGYLSAYASVIRPRQFWPSGDGLIGIALTDDPVMAFFPVGP